MTRRILGMVLAIVLAVLGTASVLFYVNRTRNSVADGQTAVTVLVATQRIAAGTSGAALRSRTLFQEVVMPAGSLPDDTLTSLPAELDDLVLTHDVQPRQLLLKGMFDAPTTLSGGIAVPDKMMAVSLKLAVEEEVGGFVRPGSQIAVFGTFELIDEAFKKATGQENHGTRLLLPRVEVLAVGAYGEDGVTSAQQRDSEAEATGKVTLLVTVAVTQADAEKLIHAVRGAELYLALLTDSSEVRPAVGVDNRTLLR
ncbi:RcpC/CpaB family pilus assembly protein [Catellatospora sp. KI3]|uniref:Flp pilus assembly protein CpaB n=1 Tax=Catellatospora sp. KI3 TaxID=3041620 RepID=UPI0024826833|nr:RcpC/CpaB family pilus assembly protein [Catellatospora sp. KI3]MDI1461707.1 RcpC/CpaB family pilus assembly protein [Catellatospora sp. KI3]